MQEIQKIAVFFDAENVSSKKVPLIIDLLSSKGDILFQRAYADWSIETTKPWKEQLNKIPITAIQQFHHGENQAVDKLIMMDSIEMAIQKSEIDTFSIVSSDNGYHSLALRLRELGKRVIGIGEKSKCKDIWKKSCNEFIYFEDLVENDEEILLNDNSKDDLQLKEFSLEKFLEQAYDLTPTYRETNSVLLSQFMETIYRRKSDFKVSDYDNAKSSRDLILKFPKKFKLSNDGKLPPTFYIEKIENIETENRKTGQIKRRIKNYRIITADDGGDYFFYMGEINKKFTGNILDKGTRVSFQVVNTPENNGEFENNNGRATDVMIIE